MKKYFFYLYILLFVYIFHSCTKKEEDSKISEIENVNMFSLDNMKYYYLWENLIPKNITGKSNEDPKKFFDRLTYKGNATDTKGDPWSFITDDLEGLLSYFSGVRKTPGFYLYKYNISEDSDNIALVVAYVYTNSPAYIAGLKRGSIIMKIDGKALTNDNVSSLLNNDTYEITLGKKENDTFVATSEKKSISVVELNADPILKSDIYTVNGTKIAYLLYNSFTHNYDQELITEFEKYKNEGVSELVLDLRYNGGGSVATAINIASMVVPKEAIGKVFLKKIYNKELQDYFVNNPKYGTSFLEDKLSDKASGYEGDNVVGTNLPNLNLSKIYIIGLNGTASASELIINGLKPYMNVITVGEKTLGKYVASITLKNKVYTNWAIQPIVFKSANADDETDYWDGFQPDINIKDRPDLGDFGRDENTGYTEPMLDEAIKDITGVSSKKESYKVYKDYKINEISNDYNGLDKVMLYDIK